MVLIEAILIGFGITGKFNDTIFGWYYPSKHDESNCRMVKSPNGF